MIKLFEHYRNGERVYSKIVEPVCKRYNLNHMEFTILMFLYNNPEYDSAKDIVSYKKLTKSHVSLGIKSLSDKGLLYQHIDTSNKKLIHLCLSDEAKDIAKEGRLYQEKFQNISLSGFSDSEVDLLLSFIDRINNNINNYKEGDFIFMQNDKEMLGREPVGKLLVKLAIPTVVAQLINMLYNIIDRIYIGHMPENARLALTGVGVCLPLIMIVAAFACFVMAGAAPKASIFMGKKDINTAEKIVGGSFVLQCAISITLTIILLIFNRPLLLTFGATENTIEYAVKYMNIYAIGTIFVELTLGMNAFITAQGFTKTSMLSVLIGAIINIILDPIFIFAFNMGVEGAALATVISQACSTIWVILFLAFSKKTILRLKFKNFFVSYKIMLPCIALGLSTFVMQSSESIIIVCFNSSLKAYGGDMAVGTMTIISSLTQFAMLPLQGICQGAQPISSYNYGARNPERVKKCFKLLLITCVSYSTLLWLTVMAFPGMYTHMFTTDEALIAHAIAPLRIYFAVMLIFGTQTACQMTFVSIGETVSSIIVAVVRKFVLLLPFIYLMPLIFSADKETAVFMAEPIADIIAVTFTVILFSIQFKKALKRIEPEENLA